MKTILITGAAGRIGTSLRNSLSLHYNLRCLDTVQIDNEDDAVLANILNFEAVLSSMKGVDYVIHLAGNTKPDQTWEDVYSHSIEGTYNVFEAARKTGINKVIYASSMHVLNFDKNFHDRQKAEKENLYPFSLYGVGKATGELLARFFSEKYGMSIICIRIGSFYADPPYPLTLQDKIINAWCSPDDLTQMIHHCLDTEGGGFQVLYGVSDFRSKLLGDHTSQKLPYHHAHRGFQGQRLPFEQNFRRNDPIKDHTLLIHAAIDPSAEAFTSWERWLETVNIETETLDTISYRLLPLVYDNLSELNIDHTLLPKLKGIYRRSWLENQLSLQKVLPLVKQLSEIGVKLLLLDDLNSIYKLYNGKGVRQIYTLDLLVHPDDVNKVLDFLKEQNIWPKVHFGERFLLVETPLEIWSPYDFPLTIAWRATPYLKSKQSAIEIWDQAGTADLGDCQVFTLDIETHFLRMCMRSINSRPDAAFFSMIDVAWMLTKFKKDIDWQRVIDLASRNHQILPLKRCLQTLLEYHETAIGTELLTAISNCSVSWVDRLEDRWINGYHPFPNRIYRFMRRLLLYRRSPKVPGIFGFFRYLQYTWGGSSLISLPRLFFRHLWKQ